MSLGDCKEEDDVREKSAERPKNKKEQLNSLQLLFGDYGMLGGSWCGERRD